MHVLLVEDDTVDEAAVRRMMPPPTTISCVRTLKGAVDITRKQQFNIILLDLGLPDSKGISTFAELRSAAPDVPIVVLTGIDDEKLAAAAIREGAQDFLVKGYMDARSLRNLGFAVERERLVKRLHDEQQRRQLLEDSIREQEQELSHMARVALMGEVVAEIVHEISQPLQAMANLGMTLMLGDLDDKSRKIVDRINDNLEFAQQLLRRIRQFVKSCESAQTDFDINEVIAETLTFCEFELRKFSVDLDRKLATEPLQVSADRIQIQQVLVNLVRNATDALKELDLEERKLQIASYRSNDNIVVEVVDGGKGLSIEVEKAFSPFVTTKQQGLGMGLAICKRIMKNHAGHISAERDERGTVFKITLPQECHEES